jgi:Raf kinase inhibitor-like YbhB/YbcL family protein
MRKSGFLALMLTAWMGSAIGASALTLTSPDVKPGGKFADEQVYVGPGWDCTGKNISPALTWSGAPKGAKSFAVTLYDPDAPTGSGFWHWVIFDIPGDATSLAKGAGDPASDAAPKGAIQVRSDFGVPGYGGPCPPKGDKPHHYILTLYAVDLDKLGPDGNASAAVAGFYLHFHTLAKASFTGLYGR